MIELSNALADATEKAARSVVRVDDGTRFTASGVVWADDLVVATSHGVERDDDLAVETGDGQRVAATLVGRDTGTDIAVLRLATPLAPFAPAEARLGALALAVGRPGERGLKVSLGIVSGRREGSSGAILKTDATLFPGFSGGALVDAAGDLLGVVNLGWGRGRSVAMDVALVRESVEAILNGGALRRGYLGVRTQPAELSPSLHEVAGQAGGLFIAHLEEGSPAQAAGLSLGDVILRIEGRRTDDPRHLWRILRGLREGQTAKVEFLRGGEARSLDVTLGGQE